MKQERDRPLIQWMHVLAQWHPLFGYRRIAALLLQEDWAASTASGARPDCKCHRRSFGRRRLGTSENGSLRALRPNQVWSYDFLSDVTESGRTLKLMPILDEYTRECLVLDVSTSITSRDVLRRLDGLFAERGAPAYIRSDNGPEFIAEAVRDHLRILHVETRFIEPGAPWQNAYIESTGGKLRDELLEREVFATVLEAQVLAEHWRRMYNERRPHSTLDYLTRQPLLHSNLTTSLNHPCRS